MRSTETLPRGLVESALIQWEWLRQVHPDLAEAEEPGQFNSLHERLLERWDEIRQMLPANDLSAVFSTRTDYLDDVLTTEYLRDLATQAGFETHLCDIRDVTLWTNPNGSTVFGTPDREALRTWFKLYPWECMLSDEFGSQLLQKTSEIRIVEPAWKILLSSKLILPVLWSLFPGHPNLMPAFFDKDPSLGDRYVEKPQYGRESTGVKLFDKSEVITSNADTPNPLKDLPSIYQALIDVEPHDGYHPLFGVWMVNGSAAGLMMREDKSRIVSGGSRIVPHFYRD